MTTTIMNRPARTASALLVLGLVAASLGGLVPFTSPASATLNTGGTYRIWSDGFAAGLSTWVVWDDSPASGADYWGTTIARHPNSFVEGEPFDRVSIWCAQAGTSSGNGLPNSENRYYDRDMISTLVRPTGDLSGFSRAWLTFNYWAVTGSPDDYLSAWEVSGGNWTEIWRQPALDSNGWQRTTVNVSTSSTAVAFRFYSSSTDPLGFEGAYLDFATLMAFDATDPISRVRPMRPYFNTTSVVFEYIAWDLSGGSGLSSVALYYARNPSGPWSWANGSSSGPVDDFAPPGVFSYHFEAPGDGAYYFYTVAFDKSGNDEEAPDVPDAWTVVDTRPPSLSIQLPPDGATFFASTGNVVWTGSDDGSGLDRFEVAIDDGNWTSTGNETSFRFVDLANGTHVVAVRATDVAGNRRTDSVTFSVNALPAGSSDLGGLGLWILIWIVIAIVPFLAIAALWKRKRAGLPPTSRRPPDSR